MRRVRHWLDRVRGSGTASAWSAGMIVIAGLAISFLLVVYVLAQEKANEDLHKGDPEWRTYMHDATRSGVTAAVVEVPLSRQWVHEAARGPIPAWPEPQDAPMDCWGRPKDRNYMHEEPRMKFDAALQVAVVDDAVYFGSSVENAVYSLQADSGKVRWRFFTEGPVRLAPTVYNGRVYVGSDDGYVYCLDASDGSLVWKFRAGPSDQRILGRGRMTSLWAIRTGVVVDDDIAYFGAGIFPGERIYICAVDAADGSLIWRTAMGERKAGRFDFSPQGYMLASHKHVFVPSGRTLPACFGRGDGEFQYKSGSQWPHHGDMGGTYALLTDNLLYAGTQHLLVGYLKNSGKHRFAWSPASRMVVTNEVSYLLDRAGIRAVDRAAYSEREKKDAAALDSCTIWRCQRSGLKSMIVADDVVFAGGDAEVMAVDTGSGDVLWTGKVDGVARGLAAAAGRLLVSTDTGKIHCFGQGSASTTTSRPQPDGHPYPDDELTELYRQAADTIVAQTDVTEGYCLILGCSRRGQLAYELAGRTDLTIHAIDPDAGSVKQAREALSDTEMYGTRICIDHGDLDSLPYPDYFGNLVISQQAVLSGDIGVSVDEALRVVKPCGGVLFIGQPSAANVSGRLTETALKEWAASGDINGRLQIVDDEEGVWGRLVRGPLPGAGSWTHQYGNAGNRGSSDDTALKCPLGVLWYGDPGANKFPSRHACNTAPLSINGRVFAQGVSFDGLVEGRPSYASDDVGRHLIMCFDAYNGVMYWQREIPGAYRRHMDRECSNIACNGDSLFVAVKSKCLQLDAIDGHTTATYTVPSVDGKDTGEWAYVAVADGILFGSTFERSQYSNKVFAFDIETGDRLWTHRGKNIRNNTIAVSNGQILFADARATDEQRRQAVRERLEAEGNSDRDEIDSSVEDAYVWTAVCVDAQTGQKAWEKPVDLTGCDADIPGYHGLSAICTDGVLLFCDAIRDGHHWDEFLAGDFAPLPGVALSTDDGSLLWRKALGYRSRPLVIGDTIYAEPWAFDLHTGEQKMRTNPLTGRASAWQFERPGHHCGTNSGCPNALFFRSYFTAYYDLASDHGTSHFAGYRPGCWINQVPANGLMIQPDASSGCICPYSLQSTIVFEPRKPNRAWGLFSDSGETKPVKHMNINLGAPGDRRTSDGTLWLSQPRPSGTRMGVRPEIKVDTSGGGGYFNRAVETTSIRSDNPEWIYASGCRGITKCDVPLINTGQGAALYTVRLYFTDLDNEKAGQRVFDIKLQGDTVERELDIVAAGGGGSATVVRQYQHVPVSDVLHVEFVSKQKKPAPDQAPVLSGIGIVREKVLNVGMTAPAIMLNDAEASKTVNVKLENNTQAAFTGSLDVNTPERLRADAAVERISLAPLEKTTVPVTIGVGQRGKSAKLEVTCRLVNDDGELETLQTIPVEYLGNRGRTTITASADTYVNAGSADKNFGGKNKILVDGGASEMGDRSHNIGYLRFPLEDIAGRVLSAKLILYVPSGGHTQSGDSGVVKLVEGEWKEGSITYSDRPEPGQKIGKIGQVKQRERVQRKLDVDLSGRKQLSIALEPTTRDGATYNSREGSNPPQLRVEYKIAE